MLTYFSADITLTTPWVSLPRANIEHGEYNMCKTWWCVTCMNNHSKMYYFIKTGFDCWTTWRSVWRKILPLWNDRWMGICCPIYAPTTLIKTFLFCDRTELKITKHHDYNRRVLCQKLISKAGTRNYIPQDLWDVITCPCLWYLLLAQHFWIMIALNCVCVD